MARLKTTRWLSSLVAGIFAFALGTVTAQIVQRPTFPATGKSAGISYFSSGSSPTVAADGELAIVSQGVGNASQLQYWDSASTATDAWVEIPAENAVLANFANNVTLGSSEDDFIDVNAPVRFRVWREDFEGPYFVMDFTNGDFVASVADDEMNMLAFPNMIIAYEHEVAFAGTSTASTYINNGIDAADAQARVWLIDDTTMVDATGDDAVEFVFGGTEIEAVLFIEEATDSLDAYCEIQIRLDDVSNLSDADFYFGFFLNSAIDNTFAWETANTYATYHIDDNAGNLVISTSLNGGSDLEEDSTVLAAWADNETHTLRVELSPDAVVFITDGTAETQATAILDLDATDSMVCRMGFQFNVTAPGLELNYVEIGKEQ